MSGIKHKGIAGAMRVVSDWTGFSIPRTDMATLMASDVELASEIFQHGASDTIVRESLMDAVMVSLVGRPWPTYGEEREMGQEAYGRLMESVRLAAVARGWIAADAEWGKG